MKTGTPVIISFHERESSRLPVIYLQASPLLGAGLAKAQLSLRDTLLLKEAKEDYSRFHHLRPKAFGPWNYC
jgi:hypothetical protein